MDLNRYLIIFILLVWLCVSIIFWPVALAAVIIYSPVLAWKLTRKSHA